MRGDRDNYPEGYPEDAHKAKKAASDLLKKNEDVILNTEKYLGIAIETQPEDEASDTGDATSSS